MTPTRHGPCYETGRPAAEIAWLVDVAGREDERLWLLDGLMGGLHEVQQADPVLKGLTAVELREALERRRAWGEPA